MMKLCRPTFNTFYFLFYITARISTLHIGEHQSDLKYKRFVFSFDFIQKSVFFI